MAAKKKSSIGDKVKQIVKSTAKQTGKDLLMLGTIVGPGKAVKAGKIVKTLGTAKKAAPKGVVRNSQRGTKNGDYVVSGKASSRTMPKAGKADAKYSYGRDAELSKNVKIKDAKSPSGKTFYTGGTLQVINQNARLGRTVTQAEAKANARGLKAANKPTKAGKVMKKSMNPRKMENVPADVSARLSATVSRLAKEAPKKKK